MDQNNLLLLNTLKFGYKSLDMTESKGFINLHNKDNQLPTGFYGNRIVNLAKTTYPGIYLCVDRYNIPFDILVKKDEIVELNAGEIRNILQAKDIKHEKNSTKKHLLSLLGIEYNPEFEETEEPGKTE